MKECEAVAFTLPDNMKAIILNIATGMSKSEKSNVATLVNMESKLGDCYDQMKTAIRKICHTDKENQEVLLAEDEWIPADPVDDILFGESRSNGNGRQRFQKQQRGFRDGQDRGQRYYRNDYRNEYRNDYRNERQQGNREGGYQNYERKGLVQRIEELNPHRRDFIEMTIGMNIVMTTEMIGSKVTEREVIKTLKGKVWYRGLKN